MRRRDRGFTLIELLIVITILGVIAGLTLPRLAGRTEKAKVKAAKSDVLGGISLALDLYEADIGRYPDVLAELVRNEAGAEGWDGPYVKRGLPKDPWQRAYVYQYPGNHGTSGYDLYSAGPDGKEKTEDDITNWEEE